MEISLLKLYGRKKTVMRMPLLFLREYQCLEETFSDLQIYVALATGSQVSFITPCFCTACVSMGQGFVQEGFTIPLGNISVMTPLHPLLTGFHREYNSQEIYTHVCSRCVYFILSYIICHKALAQETARSSKSNFHRLAG